MNMLFQRGHCESFMLRFYKTGEHLCFISLNSEKSLGSRLWGNGAFIPDECNGDQVQSRKPFRVSRGAATGLHQSTEHPEHLPISIFQGSLGKRVYLIFLNN